MIIENWSLEKWMRQLTNEVTCELNYIKSIMNRYIISFHYPQFNQKMPDPKYLLVLTLTMLSCQCFQINNDQTTTFQILTDEQSNITESELNLMKRFIAQAESEYNSTEYTKIARYVFNNMRNVSLGVKWNVYVHSGKIRQIGLSSIAMSFKKYIWMIGYGKYNFTYTLFGINGIYCAMNKQFGGGASTAQFGEGLDSTDQQKILLVMNNSIIYQGNDIQSAAAYISDKIQKALGSSVWTTIIADPNTEYGYYVCRSLDEKWVAFRAFLDFKWNYFATLQ